MNLLSTILVVLAIIVTIVHHIVIKRRIKKYVPIIYTKDTLWTNIHGKRTRLKNLDDSHIANLINWTEKYEYSVGFIKVLYDIAKDRGLTKEYLNKAQIPYKNPKGNLEIWDFDKHTVIEVSKNIKDKTCT